MKLLAQATGSDIQRYVHAPRGIHAIEDASGWDYMLQDGLGSVRKDGMSYEPYGKPMGNYGEGFGFTGEYTDSNELLYLRARYYAPEMTMFTGLDPFEGISHRPMSLNGYSWVEGNIPNLTDPSGEDCCECDSYLHGSEYFDTQAYIACLIRCRNGESPTSDEIALNSAVIIYPFLDGTPNQNGAVCNHGSYPSSISLGVITSQGIFTHDHYSLLSVEDLSAPELRINSRFATSVEQAQTYLSQFGCIEVRGRLGSVALAGASLSFGNTPDGVVLIQGNFSSVGCAAQTSSTFPRRGDSVSYIHVQGDPALVISHKPVFSVLRNSSLSYSEDGLRHSALSIGRATIDWDFEHQDFGYGSKPVFATGQLEGYETTAAGDSGSGWFSETGGLIGVTQGYLPKFYGFTLQDIEYFSPIMSQP